jgi:hypothetical protein
MHQSKSFTLNKIKEEEEDENQDKVDHLKNLNPTSQPFIPNKHFSSSSN